jgi:hypothetical protein
MKIRGKSTLYYFSKDPTGAINNLPRGFEVIENEKTGLPFLRKKVGGGFLGGFGQKSKVKKDQNQEKEVEKTPEKKE